MNLEIADQQAVVCDEGSKESSLSECPKVLEGETSVDGGAGKEVAIQANAHEIERSSGQLPLRKRFVPLKFSDYCVFANNVKEEEEEEDDSSFTPTEPSPKEFSQRTDKAKRGRGRPRKKNEKDQSDVSTRKESEESGVDGDKKHSIMKVSNGFKCGTCGRVFSLRGNAKAHLITHTDDKPFKCDFEDCDKNLRTKESLRRHKLSHMGIKMFECTQCHKKFSCNLSLHEHMNLHTGDKPLSCGVCGLHFRQIAVLKRHIATHSNDKPFACEICGKRFSLKLYVRSHMKTHTGERPFACDVCNKCFAHASDLNRHKIIHSGKKPYECSVCSMKYSDPSSRRRHEREHQNKQQYVCHLCNQQFPRAGQLRLHLVKEHATTATTFDQQNLPFKVEIQTTDQLQLEKPWTPTDDAAILLSLQPGVVPHSVPGSQSQTSGSHSEDQAMAESVQIVLDSSSCPQQVDKEKDVSSLPLSNEITSMNDGGQVLGVEIMRDADTDKFAGFPASGTTYKVITTGDGNQVLELQVDKESQGPFQDLSGEMKINLPNLKIADGLVAFIQDGNTVTVLEQTLASSDLCMELVGSKDQESMGTKYGEVEDSQKIMEVENALSGVQDPPNVKEDSLNVLTTISSSPVPDQRLMPSEQSVDYNPESAISQTDSNTEMNTPPDTEGQSQLAAVAEIPQYFSSSITSIFIENPDLSSQEYYNWLSAFSEECKQFTMPLTKEVFQKISQVQKTLSDFMAMPTGVITDKNNFKILMGITQDLAQITSSHLSFMFTNLDK